MKTHRFYVSETIRNTNQVRIVSAEVVDQTMRVLKIKPGREIIIFDNTGFDYEVVIIGYDNYTILGEIKKKSVNKVLPKIEVHLFASIVKKSNFEWIVEKATELGVSSITPIISARSEKKDLNMERLKKISIEASEQSGRGTLPTINEIMDFEDSLACAKEKNGAMLVAFHTEGEALKNEDLQGDGETVSAFVGPEGGWTPEEIEMFHKNNILVRNMGPQVLRAETAVVAALSKLVF
ncbi:MAG: RsmE family RNA methyltransferase [bacterium]|nr:RsmE family RNA methyltransferase [bacterium]